MVQFRFNLVEVVGVEPTSYTAAKKLSTCLVYLLFLKYATRVNTLCAPQEAKYSYTNTSRFIQEFSVLMTPRPQPTDKLGATFRFKRSYAARAYALLSAFKFSGTFYRRRSVYGMLISSLTGNRIRDTPISNCGYFIIHTFM